MANTIELATAYVTLVPSFRGGPATIAAELTPAATTAGITAGTAAGTGFAASFIGGLGGAKLAVLAIGAPILAIGGLALKAGLDVDEAMDNIRSTTGATGEELSGLKDVFRSVGAQVPNDLAEVGTAVADLNQRTGLTGPTLETLSRQILEVGNIQGVAVNVNDATGAFAAFNVKGADTVGAMDDLFRVSQATGVPINELTATMTKQGSALNLLGFSFTDTAALIGTLDKAGINSTAVVAGLGKSLVNLAKDGEEPAGAFKRVTGEIGQFVAKGDTAAALDLASKVFGTKGAGQFVAALQNGTVNLDAMTASAGLTSDSILGVAEETKDFPELFKQLGNAATLALEPLGTVLLGAITEGLRAATPLLAGFAGWFASIDPAILGIFLGIAAAIGGIAVSVGIANFAIGLFNGVVTIVRGVVMAWTAVQWLLNAALLANPIGIVVVALALLGASLVWAYNNVGWFRDGVNAAWQWISAVTIGVFSAVAGFLAGVWANIQSFSISASQAITGAVTGAWSFLSGITMGIFMGIAGFLGGIWAGIRGTAIGAVSGLVGFVVGGFSNLVGIARGLFGGLLGFLGGIWGGIVSGASGMVGNVTGFFASLPGRILGAIGGLGGMLLSAGVQAMQGFISGITSMAGRIFSAAVDAVRGAIDGVKNFLGIKSPSKLAHGIGVNFGLGMVGGFNAIAGDVAASALAMTPHPAPIAVDVVRNLHSNGDFGPGAGGGGGLTVQGDIYGADAEEIVDEIDRRARRTSTLNDLRKVAAGAL